MPKMIDENIRELLAKWRRLDENPTTMVEMSEMEVAGDSAGLQKRLTWALSFGTAGIRALMGAGFNQLNDLTILLLSQGFARHLKELKEGKEELSVVVGYDGRHNSKRFAQLSASVFVQHGIRVHFFDGCVPTPVVSFAVPKLECDAGLMITASHNPKEDNGYKAYWSNGAQILEPHDKRICQIAQNSEPEKKHWDLDVLGKSSLLVSAEPVLEQYYRDEAAICCFYRELNAKSRLRVTYSAFHGVGSKFVRKMFKEFAFPVENLSFVKEQDEPDPDFPTVPFPNPEEGHRVLQLCLNTADANGATLVLANDPDADRLQLAEKQANGQWRIFTGNEMGALLSWWIWSQWRQRNPKVDPSSVFLLNSAVSSQIVATMARQEGFQNRVALTGFKWIGNLADQLRAEGKQVLLAWEESIGFSVGSTRDKDGVSAAAVFAEMANWLLQQRPSPVSLQQQLFAIYRQYGFHLCRNSYWIVPGPEETRKLFADLRAGQNYPEELGASGKVQFVRDLSTGFDNSQPDKRAVLPLSTSSEMVTFTLLSGSVVTLRASGTEPKLKYYIELRTEAGKTEGDLAEVEKALDQLERDVVDCLLQPGKYGLISRD